MNKFEIRKQESFSRAMEQLQKNNGILIASKKEKDKECLLVECKRHHQWWTTVYKLNQTDYDWCPECYHFERAEETRIKTYTETCDYLKKQKSHLIEKSYDFKKQHLHVYCDVHNGNWNQIGYEATRIKRENLTCPVCREIQKENLKKIEKELGEKKEQELKEKKERELREIREKKLEEKRKIKLQQEEKKQLIALENAKEKLVQSGCKNITVLYPDELHYTCECGREYTKTRSKIMRKDFHYCSYCSKKIAWDKNHKIRLEKKFEEICAAAKLQHIEVISTEMKSEEEGIQFISPKGKKYSMSYKRFKCRKGNLDPDFKKGGTSIPEILCREIIEQLTGKEFPEGHPEGWLYPVKNCKSKLFSVDMYNCKDFETPIAFEYWGHDVHIKPKETSSRYNKITKTQKNDLKKAEYARKTNTKLIIIKGYDKYVSLKRMIRELKQLLEENNIPYDKDAEIKISSEKFYSTDFYTKIQKICETHKPASGRLLTDVIPSVDTPIEIECNLHKHKFTTTPVKIIYSGHWNCMYCRRELARERNLLTPEIIQNRLHNIPYPFEITFIKFLETQSCHALASWDCSKHGSFKKRVGSVIYNSNGRYHGCPECEKIMYPKK